MKKLIVEEVNLFRSEVRTAARSNQKGQCVLQFQLVLVSLAYRNLLVIPV